MYSLTPYEAFPHLWQSDVHVSDSRQLNAFQRDHFLNQIQVNLSFLSAYAKMSNNAGDGKLNRILEEVFCSVLTTVYGYELKNLNYVMNNHPAIDLGSDDGSVCYQITTDNSWKKIEQTVDAFFTHKLDRDYERLTIFFITEQKCPKYKKPTAVKIKTMNINDLFHEIKLSSSDSKLLTICHLVRFPMEREGLIATSPIGNVERKELDHGRSFLSAFKPLREAILDWDRPLRDRLLKRSFINTVEVLREHFVHPWIYTHPHFVANCPAINQRQQHLRQIVEDIRSDLRSNDWGLPKGFFIEPASAPAYYRPDDVSLSSESERWLAVFEERLRLFITAYAELERLIMTGGMTPPSYWNSLPR